MEQRHRHYRKESGAALISALIAIIVITSMALGLSMLSLGQSNTMSTSQENYRALTMANNALAIAFNRINSASIAAMADGALVYEASFGTGRAVQVTKGSTASAGGTMMQTLIATATWDTRPNMGLNIIDGWTGGPAWVQVRTIEGVVGTKSITGSFPSGAFGLTDLQIGGNFMTDSYDSSNAPYDPLHPGTQGNVGTNGLITITGNSFSVKGAANQGPGNPPIVNNNIFVNPSPPLLTPVQVVVPNYLPPSGANRTFSNTLTGPSGNSPPSNYRFSSLTTRNNTPLTISGKVNIFVDGDIDLKGDIVLADDTSVVNIYQSPINTTTNSPTTISVNGGGSSNGGITVTVPEQIIDHPATTTNIPASSRTVAASSQNQGVPSITAGEGTPVPTYTTTGNGNHQTTTVSYWTISTPARTVVTAAYTEIIPAHTVTTTGGIPSHFNIISTTTGTVKINGNSTFYGTVVAPNAEVTMNGTSEKFGAVLGKSMKLLGTGDFHNDTAARSPGLVSLPILLSIREVSPVVPTKLQLR